MSYSSEVLTDSPLLYWRLGESSGTTAADSSGNSRSGTYNNTPTLGVTGLLTGDSDTAVTFNGVDESVFIAYASWMAPTALTVEAIISTTATGTRSIIDRDGTSQRSFQFRLNNGKLEFATINGGAGVVLAADTGASINDGNRHHVAATYDASNIKLYVDGALVKTTAAVGALSTQTPDFRVAVNASVALGAQWFSGTIDEVAYYGTALSGTRIAAHASAMSTASYVAAVPNPAAVGSIPIPLASVVNAAGITTAPIGAAAVQNPANIVADQIREAGVTNPATITAITGAETPVGAVTNPAAIVSTWVGSAAVVNPAVISSDHIRQAAVVNPARIAAALAAEQVTGASTVEVYSAANAPTDAVLVEASSSVTTTSAAETPGDGEYVTAGSRVVVSSHAVASLDIKVNPVTLRPDYRVIVVDQFGNPGPELTRAVMGDAVRTLNSRGGFTFSMPKDDPLAAHCRQFTQVQVWIGAEPLPEGWYIIVDPATDDGPMWTYQCSGLRWLLENVRIGKERPELLRNGGFEDGLKYWTPTWFAGSAAEAPPDVQIVTGDAALDGGKALQTTAVEKVVTRETQTAAIFLGNRPYAWEPLEDGFVSGGEQIIRDMVADIPQGTAITVECYTADVDSGTGQALSERRAEASKDVIEAYRPDLAVSAFGRGETVQVASNATPAGQAKNRRIVITYGATRIGHRQATVQRFSYTHPASAREAIELELDGWLNLIDYVGPSKDRWGFYIDRRASSAPETIIDVQHTDLPPTFPKEAWKPDGTDILAPADSTAYTYEVRLYGSAGDTKFDEISVKPNVKTAFFNVTRPELFQGLVEHAQDPVFGKIDLNIETYCPVYGTRDDYSYQHKDHVKVDDAIAEQLRADDAPDFGIVTTRDRRIATTWGRRGRRTGITLELGGIVDSYTSAISGDDVATTAIVTSTRSAGGTAEAFVRGEPINGLVLERLQAGEQNRQVSRLQQMGAAMLRYGRTDVITSVTCDPKWTVYLLSRVGLGDICPIVVDDGGIDADGDYRIVEIRHSIARHQLTFDVVPEV